MYTLWLSLHIIGIALWLGPNLAMGVGSSRAAGQSNEINAWWADTQGHLGRTLKNSGLILILATGLILIIAENRAEFSDAHISLGFFTVIVGGALGGMVFTPGCRAIAKAFRSGQVAEATPVIKKLGMVGTIESVLVVVTIVAMIYKWGVG